MAVKYITDEYSDNGIDAVYRDPEQRVTFLVQSKWDSDGAGSIELGEVHKFLKGFNDFLEGSNDRFGVKMNKIWPQVSHVLTATGERIQLVLIYTGSQPINAPQQTAINDALAEVNDPTELVFFKNLSQGDIFSSLEKLGKGLAVNEEISLSNWGHVPDPFMCYYGQTTALELASLHRKHGSTLFEKNIRFFRGETDVNQKIQDSAINSPSSFFYLNNGVTILCEKIDKKPIGGAGRDMGIFVCKGISIVNGAQTVGTLGKISPSQDSTLQETKLLVRLISLENAPSEFAPEITKATNTQNRIEARDFVSLDDLQKELQLALAVKHQYMYVLKATEDEQFDPKRIDFPEVATALACVNENVWLSVQAKREVGKLWEDTSKAPYTILFNKGLSAEMLLNSVLISREIKKSIDGKAWPGKQASIAVHGNRFITYRTFLNLKVNKVDIGSKAISASELSRVANIVNTEIPAIEAEIQKLFPSAYLHSLFKNRKKIEELNAKMGSPKAIP